MKTFILICTLLCVCFFSACQNPEDWVKVREKIKQDRDIYVKAMIANDLNTIKSFYTDDVISLPEFIPVIHGLDNLEKMAEKNIADGLKHYSGRFKITDFWGSGDLAVEIGEWDATFSLPGSEERLSDNGKYVTVWQKQPDGKWKIKTETWNKNSFPGSENADAEN